MALATKLHAVFEENLPEYKFCLKFFKLLALFEKVRRGMLCKKLENNWEESLIDFMNSLSLFMDQSDSIGLINFHMLNHSMQICKKYNAALGCIGSDSTIESFHSHVMSTISPHLGKSPVFIDNSIAYDSENMPSQNIIDYHLNLFSRALEIAMLEIPDKNEIFEHKDHSKSKCINLAYIKNHLSQINSKPIHFDLKKKSQKFEQNIKHYVLRS